MKRSRCGRSAKWERELKPLYIGYLAKHGHLDVARKEPKIGKQMGEMRRVGEFRSEFEAEFPGQFWESHLARVWKREHEPKYKAHFEKYGHLDVGSNENGIGKQMSTMRSTGAFREEFDKSFPGAFWASHSARMWECRYKPLYAAYKEIHGHLDVASNEPVIGRHMETMRSRGGFRKRFEVSFPGDFWESHSSRLWEVKYYPLYAAYLKKHGDLDVPYSEPTIGKGMYSMRATNAFRTYFDVAFPGKFRS